MPQIGRVWATLGIDATTWEAGLKKAQRSLRQAGRSMQSIGTSMSKAITAPLMGMAGAALKMATDFNKSMSAVATLLPKGAERVQELKKEVQALAIETGKSTQELSEGLYELISSFGDSADSATLLKIHSKAAGVGLGSLADSIAHAKSVLDAWGESSVEAHQKVTDLGQQVIKLGKTTLPALALGIQKVAPRMKVMGISMEEMYAAFATFTGSIGTASEVGTAVRGISKAFEKPSKDMAKFMGKMAAEPKKFIAKSGGFAQAIQKVYQESTKLKKPIADFIPEVEGSTLAIIWATTAMDQYKQKLAEMGKAQGTVNQAAEDAKQINGLGKAFDQLTQRMVVSNQIIGDALTPAMMQLLKDIDPMMTKIEGLARAFATLNPELQSMAIQWAAIFAASGPLMIVLGKFVSYIGIAFGTTGTVVVAIAGVAATVPAIIWALVKVFEDAFEAIKKLPEVMITVWQRSKQGIIEIVDSIGAYIRDKATGWTKPFQDFADKTKQILTDLKNVVVGHSIVPDMVDAVLSHWNRLASGVDIVVLANEKLVKSYQRVNAMAVKAGFGTPTVALPGQTPWGLGGNFPQQAPMPGVLQGQSSTDALRQKMFTAQTQAYKPPTPGLNVAKDISQDVVKAMGDGLKQLFTSGEIDFAALGMKIAEGLISKATDWISDQVAKLFENIFTGASESLTGSLIEGAGFLTEAGEGFLGFLKEGASLLMEAGSSIIKGLGSVMSNIPGVGGIFSAIGGIFGFHKGGLITAHQGWGPDSRLIHAQTGEGIINRGAMRRLERNYGPATFGYLNRGQMPPGAGGGAGGGGVVINNHFPNQSQVEVDRFARRLGWALRRQDLGSLA